MTEYNNYLMKSEPVGIAMDLKNQINFVQIYPKILKKFFIKTHKDDLKVEKIID